MVKWSEHWSVLSTGALMGSRDARHKDRGPITRATGNGASHLLLAVIASALALQGCSSASGADAAQTSAKPPICEWSCVQQYQMLTTCTELSPETTATDSQTQCIDNTSCEELPPVPIYNDPAIPCGSQIVYRYQRDYIGSCADWRDAGSPSFAADAPKQDGTPCNGDVECLSNNCLYIDTTNAVCADPCWMGACSAGFACRAGYCFPTETPADGGSGTLFDGTYCRKNADCISGNCVPDGTGLSFCADSCSSGQCSENFTCVGGFCMFACPSTGT